MLARLACSAARAELPVCYNCQSAVTASALGPRFCAYLFHSSCSPAASRPGPAPSHKSSSSKAKPVGSKPAGNQLVSQQPDSAWTPVVHQQTGLTYYWNKSSGETTALGEPLPGPEGRRAAPPVISSAPSLLGLVGTGAGFGLVFGIMGYLIG